VAAAASSGLGGTQTQTQRDTERDTEREGVNRPKAFRPGDSRKRAVPKAPSGLSPPLSPSLALSLSRSSAPAPALTAFVCCKRARRARRVVCSRRVGPSRQLSCGLYRQLKASDTHTRARAGERQIETQRRGGRGRGLACTQLNRVCPVLVRVALHPPLSFSLSAYARVSCCRPFKCDPA
jgi:hypothetical protein